MYNDSSINDDVLQDLKTDGKEQPWRDKKLRSLQVAESFQRLKMNNRADRVNQCADVLVFGGCDCSNKKKLLKANFCRDRLCPMCAWRRSKRLHVDVMKVIHRALEVKKMRFIFLTLTVENCQSDDLCSTIDSMFEGFRRLFQYKQVDDVTVGWVRCLEITRNNDKQSENYDTYHPHFHVLIGVKPSYFTGKEFGYLNQAEWTSLWQKAAKLAYTPIVNVKATKPKKGHDTAAAVAETAKYTVKDTDYIHKSDEETDSVIAVLAKALQNRRLVGFGKLFKDVKHDLNLKDVESDDADLVGDDEHQCNCSLCGSPLKEMLYGWNVGFSNYIRKNL